MVKSSILTPEIAWEVLFPNIRDCSHVRPFDRYLQAVSQKTHFSAAAGKALLSSGTMMVYMYSKVSSVTLLT